MLDTFLTLVRNCGNDVDIWNSNNIYHLIYFDFEGFTDEWDEEFRAYSNPEAVEILMNWLENNGIETPTSYGYCYMFENFQVHPEYSSADI